MKTEWVNSGTLYLNAAGFRLPLSFKLPCFARRGRVPTAGERHGRHCKLLRGQIMDLLEQARKGFQTVEADAAFTEQALKFLGQWLTRPEFAAYRPQLEWLIQTQQWP